MLKKSRIFDLVGIGVYVALFMLVALYVFIEEQEGQPASKILQWGYLIPVAMYAAFSLWVSFGLFLLFKKIVKAPVSFVISLVIGIPVGLLMFSEIIRLTFL